MKEKTLVVSSDPVAVATRPDRVVVTLQRPEARNAINRAMSNRLYDVCGELERDPRPLIITGADGTFAAGADIAELRRRGATEARERINSRLLDRIAAARSDSTRCPGAEPTGHSRQR